MTNSRHKKTDRIDTDKEFYLESGDSTDFAVRYISDFRCQRSIKIENVLRYMTRQIKIYHALTLRKKYAFPHRSVRNERLPRVLVYPRSHALGSGFLLRSTSSIHAVARGNADRSMFAALNSNSVCYPRSHALRGNADRSMFAALNSNSVCSYPSKSDNSDRFSFHVCIPTRSMGTRT